MSFFDKIYDIAHTDLFKYVFHSGRDKVFVANVSKISTPRARGQRRRAGRRELAGIGIDASNVVANNSNRVLRQNRRAPEV